ncbi:Predicted amidohydrolase [Cribrihabitans marinus]|uniref:Predicted amidohydrolase n=1 Tax=Cribrihabitans marinus TaxID=1227549 RepID=A0A1H7DYP7_9RHOB|nr:carbon-nitrogen hydrolase family protein [Cribrihabitans marinus]GGH39879.1 amidohydrolase [Cribrihabitans marinus]SEK04460.1 Predicted amidohydrolase [Cribrihabitans marinus]
MKIATAAYPLDWLDSWAQYEDKIARWVSDAAGQGADLLVFPEYGAMELATLAGADAAGDLERSIHAVSDRMADAAGLHRRLAAEHRVHILGASAPVAVPQGRPVNRAEIYTPDSRQDHQDKQIMTRFERETWEIAPGGPLKLFDTTLGRIGVLICYDVEFPLLGRALTQADLILVPSCTEALSGYWRVRIGAMARALENQCVTVMASVVGKADWSEAVDTNTGCGGVFGPPDTGFPQTGVLAEGELNRPGWTYAELDPAAIAHVRADGVVLNRAHWSEQDPRAASVTNSSLLSEGP